MFLQTFITINCQYFEVFIGPTYTLQPKKGSILSQSHGSLKLSNIVVLAIIV